MLSSIISAESQAYFVHQQRVGHICELAKSGRFTILALMCAAAAKLLLAFYLRRRRMTIAKYAAAGMPYERAELGVSSSSGKGAVREKTMEVQNSSVYELPAERMSRVEGDDVAYREMQSDWVGRELRGHEVAAELPAHGSRRRSI